MKKEMKKTPIAACYCRLSDDDPSASESISIDNQRILITMFCQEQGITIYDYYIDDGYTGTNFDRPSFKRMMNDIERGRVNTIIVKDISRFGREEANVLNYIERVLPEKNIDFIAVTDQLSSLDPKGFDMSTWMQLHFKVLFNEYLPAETSFKLQEILKVKARNGEYLGSQAPFGYMKSPEDKHKLVIDPAIAPIVVHIFEMAAYSGYGYNRIARELSKEKVLKPSALQAQRANRPIECSDPYDWHLTTVKIILENEVYLGNLISGKRRKLNFKSKKEIRVSEDEWIRNYNMHEPIISEQLWNDAHEKLDSRKRTTKSDFVNIFAGLVKCEDCGYALGITNPKRKQKNYMSCDTYRKKGPAVCKSHLIRYDVLYDIILADIKRVLAEIQNDPDRFKTVTKELVMSALFDRESITAQIADLEADIERSDKRYNILYEDRINGIITPEKFRELTERFQDENREKRDRLDRLKDELASEDEKIAQVDRFVETISEYTEIEELDKELLNKLISKITVGERRTDENKKVTQRVTIYYKFLGSLGTYEHAFN